MELGVAPVIVVLNDQALSQIKIKQHNKRLAVAAPSSAAQITSRSPRPSAPEGPPSVPRQNVPAR